MSFFGGKSRTGSNLIQFLGGHQGFLSRSTAFINGIMNAISDPANINIPGISGRLGSMNPISNVSSFAAPGLRGHLGTASALNVAVLILLMSLLVTST